MEKEANIKKKTGDGKRLLIPCPKYTVILIKNVNRATWLSYTQIMGIR